MGSLRRLKTTKEQVRKSEYKSIEIIQSEEREKERENFKNKWNM